MAELVFDCLGARSDRYAAGPTLNFRLRVARDHRRTRARDRAALPAPDRTAEAPLLRRRGANGSTACSASAARWADTLDPLQFANVVDHGAELHRQRRGRRARAVHLRPRDGRARATSMRWTTARSRWSCCSAAPCSRAGTTGVQRRPGAVAQGGRLPAAGGRVAADDGPLLPRTAAGCG